MTHSINLGSKLSEVDVAFKLLQEQESPKYYYDLIEAVLTRLAIPIDASRISSVLTQINLDTRFAYCGKGEWGLKAWVPARSSKKLPSITSMNKSIVYDEETEKDFSEEANEDMDDLEDLENEMEEGKIDLEDSSEEANEDRRERKWG